MSNSITGRLANIIARLSNDELKEVGLYRSDKAPNGEYVKFGEFFLYSHNPQRKDRPEEKKAVCTQCGDEIEIDRLCKSKNDIYAEVRYCLNDDCDFIRYVRRR